MVKIDVISGFLGAGKTTLIKKFIQEAFQGEKLVLVENEFGEVGVDGGFLKDAGIEIKEMNSGCICCSLVGDFEASLKEVIETYKPERIIIEPSGVGKLSDVEKAILDVDTEVEIQLNNKIAVVNAKKAKMYMKNFGEFFVNQVAHADAIVLSRTSEMNEEELEVVITSLREHNEKATIITTPWDKLDGKGILNSIENQNELADSLLKEISQSSCGCGEHHHEESGCGCGNHHHEESSCGCGDHYHEESSCGCGDDCGCGDHHNEESSCGCGDDCGCGDHHDEESSCGCGDDCGCGNHHHEEISCGCGEHHHGDNCGCGHDHSAHDVFTSWGVETATKYTQAELQTMLDALENSCEYGTILRAKGMLECEDGEWAYFDYVPGESELRTGIPCTTGKLCVIGAGIKEDKLKALFKC